MSARNPIASGSSVGRMGDNPTEPAPVVPFHVHSI